MKGPDWDAKYAAAPDGLYGDAPNEYLRLTAARHDFAPRRALMLADGDGRNGRWLAGLGLDVVAVDASRVATEQGRALDRAAGLAVRRIHADLADWEPEGRFDLVGVFSLHCEPEVRRTALDRALAALDPGGWLVIEGFSRAQAARPGIGPNVPDNLYALDQVLPLPDGMVLVEALEGLVRLDEGRSHRGEAAVMRLTARR